jgi:hypothetical protein
MGRVGRHEGQVLDSPTTPGRWLEPESRVG